MQKIKIISIFFLLFLFQNIYAQTEKIIIDKESEYYLQIDKDNCLKIIISDSSNKTSKIILDFLQFLLITLYNEKFVQQINLHFINS